MTDRKPGAIKLPGSIPLFTRMGREIENVQDPDLPPGRIELLIAKFREEHRFAQLRRRPTGQYNCHGMVFANRRTCVPRPEDVDSFLADDGYTRIKPSEAQEGDIVVYYDGNEISHTGVVLSITRRDDILGGQAVTVLNKWAQAGEYLHAATYGPYADNRLTYWTDRVQQ